MMTLEEKREYARTYRMALPEESKENDKRKYRTTPRYVWKRRVLKTNLKKRYGLSIDEYFQMVKSQNEKCKICEGKINGRSKERLSIDHDHSTKIVRGLLCQRCNSLLGMSRDDQFILHSAIKYLQNASQEYRRPT